ncbi:MAG: hypothetical protein R2706_19385 [Acidimicrobiales bacterium]
MLAGQQFEEVYLPYQSDPIEIPRQSEALYLLHASATSLTGSRSRITGSFGISE